MTNEHKTIQTSYTCSGCRKQARVNNAHMKQWSETDKSHSAVCLNCHYHMESLGLKYLEDYLKLEKI